MICSMFAPAAVKISASTSRPRLARSKSARLPRNPQREYFRQSLRPIFIGLNVRYKVKLGERGNGRRPNRREPSVSQSACVVAASQQTLHEEVHTVTTRKQPTSRIRLTGQSPYLRFPSHSLVKFQLLVGLGCPHPAGANVGRNHPPDGRAASPKPSSRRAAAH